MKLVVGPLAVSLIIFQLGFFNTAYEGVKRLQQLQSCLKGGCATFTKIFVATLVFLCDLRIGKQKVLEISGETGPYTVIDNTRSVRCIDTLRL